MKNEWRQACTIESNATKAASTANLKLLIKKDYVLLTLKPQNIYFYGVCTSLALQTARMVDRHIFLN